MNPAIEREIARAVGVMRRQHKALSTERDYAGWLRRYFRFVYSLPRDLTSEKKAEAFLTSLAQERQVSASTQNVAFNAICFFYKDVLQKPLQEVDSLRATRGSRVRHAPTVQETFDLLAAVKDVGGYSTNLVARLLYGCGLRVTEPLNLRTKDVQEDRLFIMGGKGRKDRVVSLPDSLVFELQGQLDFARTIWRRDVDSKIPVEMPEGLARKYPEYRFAWGWAWVFPGHQPCRHPRTGEWVRWRMHEANVQRAIKEARRRLGIMVLPHELRHAYATHCLDRGTNVKALQEAMGHSQVETTIGYCHATALSVRSPLEQPPSPGVGTMLAVVAPRPVRSCASPPLCEPVAESIGEPLEVNSSQLTALKGISKTVNCELLKGSHNGIGEKERGIHAASASDRSGGFERPSGMNAAPLGEAKRDRIRAMVKEALELVGPKDAREFGGWYWNRARENAGKFQRVLSAVRSDVREGVLLRRVGGHFSDLWGRFGD